LSFPLVGNLSSKKDAGPAYRTGRQASMTVYRIHKSFCDTQRFLSSYIKPKLDKIKKKCINEDLKNTIFFYRYARVMKYHSTLSELFSKAFDVCIDRFHISKQGGVVDRDKFAKLVKETLG